MLIIKNDYTDLENNNLEIVERKGIGHPDTLADKLAEECSRAYSKYCIDNYGCVLHHNIDKLYIGAGLFKYENNEIKKYQNIVVNLNGRVSNTMNGKMIDLEEIFVPVIKRYLKSVLPKLDVDNDLDININCTQNTKRDYWYSPRNLDDVPDSKSVTAGDTALCIAYGGLTLCESLSLDIERLFYTFNEYGYMTPKYNDIGQDIKIMISRIEKKIDITMCIPVLKGYYNNDEEFDNIIKKYESIVKEYIDSLKLEKQGYNTTIHVNYKDDGTIDKYTLCIGTCAECGEEGIVGRGNNSQGFIASLRPHSVEASCGKNIRYHTGRAVDYMSRKAVERIYNELGIKCILYALTRNRNSLFEPYVFYLSIEKDIDKKLINKIISEEFNEKYLLNSLEKHNLF